MVPGKLLIYPNNWNSYLVVLAKSVIDRVGIPWVQSRSFQIPS